MGSDLDNLNNPLGSSEVKKMSFPLPASAGTGMTENYKGPR